MRVSVVHPYSQRTALFMLGFSHLSLVWFYRRIEVVIAGNVPKSLEAEENSCLLTMFVIHLATQHGTL